MKIFRKLMKKLFKNQSKKLFKKLLKKKLKKKLKKLLHLFHQNQNPLGKLLLKQEFILVLEICSMSEM
ncbi:MAG: hypothetical protein EBX37_18800 [Alphaproteobacteria bacterium]|nr:hypothetical protein [Alphaproteobacteria bacterium]